MNTAARLEALVAPMEIPISNATQKRLGREFAFEEIGVRQIRGKGPVRIFRLLGDDALDALRRENGGGATQARDVPAASRLLAATLRRHGRNPPTRHAEPEPCARDLRREIAMDSGVNGYDSRRAVCKMGNAFDLR